MRRYIRGVLALAVAVSLAACMDLEVVNENNPNREQALNSPSDVESIMGLSTFRQWYGPMHSLANVAVPWPNLSDEGTNTTVLRNQQWSAEPRFQFRNDDLATEIWIPRHIYDNMSECVGNINDTMTQIKRGMRLMTLAQPSDSAVSDNTDRAVAWGKLWQGTCLGYLALTFDRAPVITEDEELPVGWEAWKEFETRYMTSENWKEGLALGVKQLERAIEVAEKAPSFQLPESWIPGTQYNNQQVIELAHTMIARLLVYSARHPSDREKVDWDKVLFHTERGLTYDFGPTLQSGVITDPSYLARMTTTGSNQFRADYRLIGQADQSGNYQAWLKTEPHSEAARFLITTPDRRITGATPTTSGAYFRYNTSTSGFDSNRGLQNWSFYQWHRRANYGGFTSTTGHYTLVSQDENRLFRAEALLRKGRLQEAADLINVTRTRGVKVGSTTTASNLPPVTTAGVPTVNGQCVPRLESGQCGTLMDALIYERAIELTGIDPLRAWLDRRGFGQLQEGTLVHFPLPARYLVTNGVAPYTFGGVGGDGSAKCPQAAPGGYSCKM